MQPKYIGVVLERRYAGTYLCVMGRFMLDRVVEGMGSKRSPESLAISTFPHYFWMWPGSGKRTMVRQRTHGRISEPLQGNTRLFKTNSCSQRLETDLQILSVQPYLLEPNPTNIPYNATLGHSSSIYVNIQQIFRDLRSL